MKLLLVLLLTVPLSAIAQNTPHLQVTGVGRLRSQPDLAILNIDLGTIRLEFSDAVSVLESDYEQMVKHLEGEGFSREDIKTSDYGIRPNWIYGLQRSYDSGFVGRHGLKVELANTKENLARTISVFSKSPVQARLSISFTVSDSLEESIRNELIKRAIADASQKAKLMAEASGQQLGKIVKIAYEGGSSGRRFHDVDYDMALMQSVPDEVVIREQVEYTVKEMSFEDEVMVTYEVKE
ncbi:MAG TPA: SIMPL domain-containing protein [Cyclobacteriaceae bacterium]|nr:SIMPL domain-containing protein [Cyclobacteriaceae bacterium]